MRAEKSMENFFPVLSLTTFFQTSYEVIKFTRLIKHEGFPHESFTPFKSYQMFILRHLSVEENFVLYLNESFKDDEMLFGLSWRLFKLL
jgi:hypothetical protein